jgi:hypothetical protein
MGTRKFVVRMTAAIMLIGLLAGCVGCSASHTQSNGEGTPCREDELSPSAVMRSTDHGATWTKLGRICLHDPSILSVDFTAIPTGDGGVALYFVDMKLLQQPSTVQRIIYRAISTDGVNFEEPEAVVTANVDMVDPTVIRLPDGRVRLYVPIADLTSGIASFISDDGLHFTRESGARNANGSMPGALVLADHRIRIFAGNIEGPDQAGITSMISDDGLTFAAESGLRIAAASPKPTDMTSDPSAIHLIGGGYLMSFMINPTEPSIATGAQYRLATSDDGFTWTVNPKVFAEGGTSCLVESSDGTLFFYYGV